MRTIVLCSILISMSACGVVTLPKGGIFAGSDDRAVLSDRVSADKTGTASAAAERKALPKPQRKLEPGVSQVGKVLVTVGCVDGISDPSLAFETAEGRAREAAARATCSSATVRIAGGNVIGRTADDDGRICVEMATPIRTIECVADI